MDEEEAIQLLKQNDLAGLETLVRKYQVQAIRAAYIIVRNRETAEDIVQQAFIRVFERIEQYDEKRPFPPWFFKIVINDAVKSATREKETVPIDIFVDRKIDIELGNWTRGFPNPEEALQHDEVLKKVWKAIEELSPEQRAAFVMRYYFSFSIPELEEKLDLPLTTIKWRLQAARKRLQKMLNFDDV